MINKIEMCGLLNDYAEYTEKLNIMKDNIQLFFLANNLFMYKNMFFILNIFT